MSTPESWPVTPDVEGLPVGSRVRTADDYVYVRERDGWRGEDGDLVADSGIVSGALLVEPPPGRRFLARRDLAALAVGSWVTDGDVEWEHTASGWRESETGCRPAVDLAHVGVWEMDEDEEGEEGDEGEGRWAGETPEDAAWYQDLDDYLST